MIRGFLLINSIVVIVVAFFVFKACETPYPTIEGYTAEGFEGLRDAYKEVFKRKLDKGSTFAAYHEGRLVAHLWAGCKDFFCTEKWQEDTTAIIHSSTKFLGALALAVMADRGHLDYKERVAKYWPEFAANGKEAVTVDQLLSHQAGLVGVEPGLTLEELMENGPTFGARLAQQKPYWTPGTEAHYHALTIGMYMEELFRRVDPNGRGAVEFLQKEVFDPLGLDIKIGLYDSHQRKRFAPSLLSHLRLFYSAFSKSNSAFYRVNKAFFWFPNATYKVIMTPIAGTWFGHDYFRDSYLRLPLLSCNGVASVRSLAELMGIVANSDQATDATFPKRFFRSPDVLQKLQEPLVNMSWMSDLPEAFFSRGNAVLFSKSGSKMIGTPGMGGQMAFADPERRIGWAFLTNHLSPYNFGDDPRHLLLQEALYNIVESKTRKL